MSADERTLRRLRWERDGALLGRDLALRELARSLGLRRRLPSVVTSLLRCVVATLAGGRRRTVALVTVASLCFAAGAVIGRVAFGCQESTRTLGSIAASEYPRDPGVAGEPSGGEHG